MYILEGHFWLLWKFPPKPPVIPQWELKTYSPPPIKNVGIREKNKQTNKPV